MENTKWLAHHGIKGQKWGVIRYFEGDKNAKKSVRKTIDSFFEKSSSVKKLAVDKTKQIKKGSLYVARIMSALTHLPITRLVKISENNLKRSTKIVGKVGKRAFKPARKALKIVKKGI